MRTATVLRIEGLVVGVAATIAFFAFGGTPLFFLALVLLPDVSMAGYLLGPGVGSRIYNVAHTYALPTALLVAGYWSGQSLLSEAGLVWIAHIGADRAFGLGLKYADADFSDTHLQRT